MVHLMLACRANILRTPVKGYLALEDRQLYWWYASVAQDWPLKDRQIPRAH